VRVVLAFFQQLHGEIHHVAYQPKLPSSGRFVRLRDNGIEKRIGSSVVTRHPQETRKPRFKNRSVPRCARRERSHGTLLGLNGIG
jgi:hypothetical protein